MYKSLFISLNLIGILIVPILYVGDVTITQSGSSQVNAGGEIEVTIDINKEGVSGPARLKLDLTNAKGIEIEEVETEGASFSFNEESALFIWYSIKSDSKVTLKYKIIADADATGSKSITGSFSYLDEDERKKKDIQAFNFTVNSDGSLVSNSEPIVIEGSDEKETVEVVTTDPSNNNSSNNNTAEDNKENLENNSNDNSSTNENNSTEEVADNIATNENNSISNDKEENNPPVVVEGEEEENTIEAISTNNNNSFNSSNETSPDKVKCNRTIEQKGNSYIITVSIYKGINGGFARVKEDIPLGFTAEKIESAGSIFKFADNSAKFLWSQIPKNVENVVVKYKLTPPSNASGEHTIRGSFSAEFLIENEKPKKIKIATSTINVGGVLADNNANNKTPISSSNNNPKKENNDSKDNKSDNSATTNTNNNYSNSDNNSETTTIGSTSTNGVKYRVQIIAAHNTVSKRYIKKVFGYSGAVNIDNHEGWVKYTTNGFKNYEEARDNRNSLNKYNFDGPFVTAYNNGDRITVQEALMLSNQTWLQ